MSNIKRYLIGAYALMLPFTDWLVLKINGILIIVFSLLWLYELCVKKEFKQKFSINQFIILSGVFFIQLLSLLHAGEMKDMLSAITIKLPFLLFPLFLDQHKFYQKDLLWIKRLFITGCLIAVLLSFRYLFYFSSPPSFFLNYHLYESYLLLHRPYFGIYLLTAIIFLFDEKRFNVIIFSVGCFFILFLVYIQAKISLFILAILILLRIIFHIKKQNRRFIYLAGIITFALVISLLFKYYLRNHQNIDHLNPSSRFFVLSINTRLIHWDCSWNIFTKHFISGIGAGNVKQAINNCYSSYYMNVYQFIKDKNAHNEFLEEAVRHGMVGLVVYFFCFLFFFKNALASRDRLYFSFLIIIVLASLTETTLSREQGVLMIAFFNTILYLKNSQRLPDTVS